MDNIKYKIIFSFLNKENLLLTDDEFINYDKFIDNEILNGNLIKYDEYNFIGEGFISQINKNVIALHPYDSRIDIRCKGQASYFLIDDQIAILTFSSNCVTFFPLK